jgi:hypothetical protein
MLYPIELRVREGGHGMASDSAVKREDGFRALVKPTTRDKQAECQPIHSYGSSEKARFAFWQAGYRRP